MPVRHYLLPTLVAVALVVVTTAASAGWLSRLSRLGSETGHVAGGAAKLELGALGSAAGILKHLPVEGRAGSLAAHATPEGHWRFANAEGEVFTAANADEIARVAATLLPDHAADGKLTFYLPEESVFRSPERLRELPDGADLRIVAGEQSYRLERRTGPGGTTLTAEIKPNIRLALTDQVMFGEAVAHLARPLNRSNIRVVALEPGSAPALSSAPRYEPGTTVPLVDALDPGSIGEALGRVRGQTILVTGRREGDTLVFQPAQGPEQKLFVDELMRAAAEADVNVILLSAASPRQPGGRNWLWQRVEVTGFADALKRVSMADFLNGVGARGEGLLVKADRGQGGRIRLEAVSAEAPGLPMTGTIGDWMSDLAGHVVVRSVEVLARDDASERERQLRIVPGIPSWMQFLYIGLIVMGLFAFAIVRDWWRRIWPAEQRGEYAGRIGFIAAQVTRALAFALVFLPLAAVPALAWSGLLALKTIVTAPARLVRWLRGRRAAATQPAGV